MDVMIFLGLLLAFYAIIYFFDRFFKSCMHYPYQSFLHNSGLSIDFLRVRLHTTALNRAIFRLGSSSVATRNFFAKYYTLGVIIAVCLLPVSLIFIIVTIFSGNTNHSSNSGGLGGSIVGPGAAQKTVAQSNFQLEVLLPGVNLPLEEIGYYISTMLCATLVHEFGHALAAVMEDVPVTGFGFQFYFCVPLAFTDVSPDQFNSLKWLRKLRILCGGIWHNCLFAAFSYLILSSVGFLAKPLYSLNEHVIVTNVLSSSPLSAGSRGLMDNDIITHINDCRVVDKRSWYDCLLHTLQQKPGYCVSSDFIRLNDESVVMSQHHDAYGILQCCDARDEQLCCFEYIDDYSNDAPVEIPQHVCLHVRRTLTDAFSYCSAGGSCERGFCLRPLLQNRTTIMTFKRLHKERDDVIYIGQPRDVALTVDISGFVPKRTFMSPQWGDMFLLFLQYNVVFNVGLAFVNVIPCFGFDGYLLVKTIINSFLANRVTERPKREFIATLVTGICTLLCVLALTKVVWLNAARLLLK